MGNCVIAKEKQKRLHTEWRLNSPEGFIHILEETLTENLGRGLQSNLQQNAKSSERLKANGKLIFTEGRLTSHTFHKHFCD